MIERLKFETVPAQWDGRDCHKMWNKINEIIDYINNEVEKRPKVLYGIENNIQVRLHLMQEAVLTKIKMLLIEKWLNLELKNTDL